MNCKTPGCLDVMTCQCEQRAEQTRLDTALADAEAWKARVQLLQPLVELVLHIHSHQRASDFMNQFHEWRGLIAAARDALALTALAQDAPEAGKAEERKLTMCGLGPGGGSCVCYNGERCNCRCHAPDAGKTE